MSITPQRGSNTVRKPCAGFVLARGPVPRDAWAIVLIMIVVSLTMTGRTDPRWLTLPIAGLAVRSLAPNRDLVLR